MSDLTRILKSGDPKEAEELLPLVYEELRKLAGLKMAGEKAGQTLQATALVHEAWLKLSKDHRTAWNDRGHFFRSAAEAMRRILIDRARRKMREKHGGNMQSTEFDDLEFVQKTKPEELIALDEALEELERIDPGASQLINLRYFAGFTQLEAAKCLGISRSSVDRSWAFAKAWLYQRLQSE